MKKKFEDMTLQELGPERVARYFYMESQGKHKGKRAISADSDDLPVETENGDFEERLEARHLESAVKCGYCGDPVPLNSGFCGSYCRDNFKGKKVYRKWVRWLPTSNIVGKLNVADFIDDSDQFVEVNTSESVKVVVRKKFYGKLPCVSFSVWIKYKNRENYIPQHSILVNLETFKDRILPFLNGL